MRLILPLLVQIGWTLAILMMLGRARVAAIRGKEVTIGAVALSNDAWPPRVKAIGNNYANQFETPVLFYALIGAALFAGATHWIMAALAWAYVATRIAHTLVHTGANAVLLRFRIFIAGVVLLVGMLAGVLLSLLA